MWLRLWYKSLRPELRRVELDRKSLETVATTLQEDLLAKRRQSENPEESEAPHQGALLEAVGSSERCLAHDEGVCFLLILGKMSNRPLGTPPPETDRLSFPAGLCLPAHSETKRERHKNGSVPLFWGHPPPHFFPEPCRPLAQAPTPRVLKGKLN
jgi:hypothetical protein